LQHLRLQLLGLKPVVLGAYEELRERLGRVDGKLRACVLCSPSNPGGDVASPEVRNELLDVCVQHGLWVISDEAYEHFVFDGAQHSSIASESSNTLLLADACGEESTPEASSMPSRRKRTSTEATICVYTASKSYGLASWRVGYMTYPRRLHEALLKIQDTLPTHASSASQRVALAAYRELGTAWVREQVATLEPIRPLIWEALRPLAEAAEFWPGRNASLASQPRGAFYYMLPVPPGMSEEAAISFLAREHGLLVLPGSAFGLSGHLRLSYGGIATPQMAEDVAARLRVGVQQLCRH